ncbi:hypothetical protein LOTGIDRAFT_109009 [Lottia gigantea]|uniref:RNA methyltransferase n=1 Tax=Lottia gigantea TaxID=225164 RepID=V3ZP55_LOTGI|nr:hypothetical protein LOTGIDRAFT_109009 [Lottia gigantea]ESO82621.1 hypothetical protein LOTGIDRAFT_109009 [Lottia gigantea]
MSECAADLVSAKELKFSKPQDSQPKDINSETGDVPNNNAIASANQKTQKGKKKKPKFIHGNYNRYYGYRNPSDIEDIRLEFFDIEWFKGKDVLDIGCNVGHLTILVAKKLSPKMIVGIDIDSSLISAARKNIRYYVEAQEKEKPVFPVSNNVVFGPMEAPPLIKCSRSESSIFPQNIVFKQGNYVLENEDQLSLVKEEYDTILALSISKWIHLNNGDEGIKIFFKRIHKHLRPGGRLILEPQPWASYKKRKNLTPNINYNFQNIKLKPEQFRDYLLAEVGFHKCEVIDVVNHKAKGFRRPIQVYTKSESSESANEPNKTPRSN